MIREEPLTAAFIRRGDGERQQRVKLQRHENYEQPWGRRHHENVMLGHAANAVQANAICEAGRRYDSQYRAPRAFERPGRLVPRSQRPALPESMPSSVLDALGCASPRNVPRLPGWKPLQAVNVAAVERGAALAEAAFILGDVEYCDNINRTDVVAPEIDASEGGNGL